MQHALPRIKTLPQAQAGQRVQQMPVDQHLPFYTLNPRQRHVIRARNQVLQVISGLAWVSNNGEDFILKAGEAITLFKGHDAVIKVSGLFGKPVEYTLKD